MRWLIPLAALIAAPVTAQTAPPVQITTIAPRPGGAPDTVVRAPAKPGATPVKADTPVTEAPRQATQNGVLVLYGNQRCPTNRAGEEIVVCVRRPPGEQYRLPKELRELVVTPENQSWAAKLGATLSAGGAGIGSCSAVGPGGASGCFNRAVRTDRAQNDQTAKEQRNLP